MLVMMYMNFWNIYNFFLLHIDKCIAEFMYSYCHKSKQEAILIIMLYKIQIQTSTHNCFFTLIIRNTNLINLTNFYSSKLASNE